MEHNPLTIYLAEDDDGHAALIQRNLDRCQLRARVVRFRHGAQALEHLREEFSKDRPRHLALLLLDIRMPGIDGTEVLRIIKTDGRMRFLPVYMLTTTDNPVEIDRCFELGCNAYLTKPVSQEALGKTITRLCEFLEVCQLPTTPPESKNATA